MTEDNKGFLERNTEMAERRMAVCQSCEHYGGILQRCNKCGCIMPLKTRIPQASCPIARWIAE